MYPILIKQSESTANRRRVYIWLVQESDGLSAFPGATGTVRLSKNGGVSANSTSSIVEIDSTNMPGLYYIELSALEVDTLGTIALSYKTTNSARWHGDVHVVAFDPYSVTNLGLSNLNATISSRAIPGDAMALTAPERDSIANVLLDIANGVETGYTMRQTLKLMAAVLLGKSSGGPAMPIYRSMTDAANRVSATADSDGNRNSVTLNP